MENKRSNAKSDLMGVSAAGVSSIAQKELSPLKRFINSSVFLVICIEIVLVAVFSVCSDGLFFSTDNLLNVGMNAAQMMIRHYIPNDSWILRYVHWYECNLFFGGSCKSI